MNVNCPQCGAQYQVHQDRIPPAGLDMKCSECLNTFHVSSGPVAPRSTGMGFPTTGAAGETRYFVRVEGGNVRGPYPASMIVQLLEGGRISGNDGVSEDKEHWRPISMVSEFAQGGAPRPNSTRFVGRPAMDPEPSPGLSVPHGVGSGTAFEFAPGNDDFTGGGMAGMAFGGDLDAELPAPVGAELPAPIGYGDAELPAPIGYGDAELPAPIGYGDAELPAPVGYGDAELPAPVGYGGAELPGLVQGSYDAELPAPVGYGGAELPGLFDAELPAPVGSELPGLLDAELPLPVGYDSELPSPLGADLPMPYGGDAEMPLPTGGEFPMPVGGDLPLPVGGELPNSVGGELPRDAFEADYSGYGEDREIAGELLPSEGYQADYSGYGQDVEIAGELPPADMDAGMFGADGQPLEGSGVPMAPSFSLGESDGAEGDGAIADAFDLNDASVGIMTGDFEAAFGDGTKSTTAAGFPDLKTGKVVDTKTKRKSASKPAKVRKSSLPKPLLVAVGGFFMLVSLGLAAWSFGLVDMLIGGDGGGPGEPTEVINPTRKATGDGLDVLLPDTHATYTTYRGVLQEKLKKKGADPDTQGKLLVASTLLLAHYPDEGTVKKEATGLAKGLKGDSVDAKLGRGAFAVLDGDEETADAVLVPLTEEGETLDKYYAHLLLGLVDLMALRSDPSAEVLNVEEDTGDDEGGGAPLIDDEPPTPAEDGSDVGVEEDGGVEADDGGADVDAVPEAEPKPEPKKGPTDLRSPRHKRALEHLEAAAKLAPKAPAPPFFMGLMARTLDDHKRAAAIFEKIVAENEEHVPSVVERAMAAYLDNDLETADKWAQIVTTKLKSKASKREYSQGFLIAGLVHVANRESDDAIRSFKQALSIDPTNTEALKQLGREFFRNRKFAEALNYFSSAKNLSRNDPEVMLTIVKSHIGLEQYKKAVQQLEAGTKRFPEDARFPYYLGRINERENNWFEARKHYEGAIKVDETYSDAHVRLAILLLRDEKKEEARNYLSKAERYGAANDPEIAVDLAQAFLMLGEENKALALLQRALQKNKSNMDARIRLARFYVDGGDAAKALELLKPIEGKGGDDLELALLLADVYRELGQYEFSIKYLDKLVEEFPKSAKYKFKLGLAYFGWGNYDTAREMFLAAYQLNPGYYDAYYYAGRTYLAQEDYKQAIKIFRIVLDEDRSRGAYRFYLGRALEKNRAPAQALDEYMQVDRYDPDYGKKNPDLYFRRGTLLLKSGQYAEAKADLQKVLRGNRSHIGALMALGDTLFDEKQYRTAIKLYEKAVQVNPNLGDAHYRLGRAYTFTSEPRKAIKAYEKAVGLGLPEPAIHEALAFLYRDSGDRGRAVKNFKKYLELKPKAANRREIELQIKRLGG